MVKLSVIVLNYNHTSLIERAACSVLEGPYADQCEVVLVDDGSVDESTDICRQLESRYENLIFVAHEQNKGNLAAARTGFRHSSGEFVHTNGADDYFLKDGINQVFEAFEKYPNADALCSDLFLGENLCRSIKKNDSYFFQPKQVEQLLYHTRFSIFGHAWFVRHELYKEFLPYEKCIGPICDWFSNHCFAIKHGVVYIPHPLKHIDYSPSSCSNGISYQSRNEYWSALLVILRQEPVKYKKLVQAGVLRGLGIRAIYKELLFRPKNWKYLLPIVRKMLENRLAKLLPFDYEKFWLKVICD